MPTVLVLAETDDDGISERSARLVAAARGLVPAGGRVVVAMALADPGPPAIAGADQVFWARSAGPAGSEIRAALAIEASRRVEPELILVPNAIAGIDTAALVAHGLGRPLVAYCTALEIQDGVLAARCELFGGRAVADVACPLPAVAIATLEVDADVALSASPAEIVELFFPELSPRIVGTARGARAAGAIDIAAAERIVCVGRGIGEEENIALARNLAEVLGAEIGASRPVVDLGWVEKERQVGKSGRTVKPKVYVALGVSGASEHLEGMRESGVVIAVNTNPAAPIFELARWGTTCDALELLPLLTEKLRAAKS